MTSLLTIITQRIAQHITQVLKSVPTRNAQDPERWDNRVYGPRRMMHFTRRGVKGDKQGDACARKLARRGTSTRCTPRVGTGESPYRVRGAVLDIPRGEHVGVLFSRWLDPEPGAYSRPPLSST
jgi:hypothetical protein